MWGSTKVEKAMNESRFDLAILAAYQERLLTTFLTLSWELGLD